MTPINAIMKSLEWAKMYIIRFNNITSILFYIALVPVITKMIKKTNYKFKYPVIFTVITFGIFAAQFTPPLYAQSGYIPKRLYCIIYYSMYWLIIGNLFYWVGYLNKKIDITYDEKMYKVLCTILVILVIASVGINFKTTNTYKAIYSLYSGEAQIYDVEMNERIKIYNDDSIKDVEVKKLTKKPFLLYETDITTNKEHWINLAVRDFFQKNSVRLIK